MTSAIHAAYKEALTHGTPQFPIQYYGTRLKDNVHDLYLHWHDEMEVIYIHHGTGTFQINFETFQVNTGDILFIPKGALHQGSGTATGCDCQTIVFHQDLISSASFDQLESNYLHPLFQNNQQPTVHLTCEHPNYEKLQMIIKELFSLMNAKTLGYELIVKGLLLQLLGHLYASQLIYDNPLYAKPTKKFLTMKTIITYIHEHFDEHITIEQLAQMAGYSEHHFVRFFKQETNMKCTDYMNQVRLRHARRLLLQSEASITEVALSSGFENLSYFCKKYKQRYDETPNQTRKNA